MIDNNHGTVLVTGATGAVGPRIVMKLLRTGYRVKTLSRHAPKPDDFPPEVEVILGDVTDIDTARDAVTGVDWIIHLAAILHINNPSQEIQHIFEKVNVQGTANLVNAALEAGVQRLVLLSTVSVYGDSGGKVLDERSPTQTNTMYGRTKLKAEKIVLEAKRSDGEHLGTVLRSGAVYGPRIKGNYARLVRALAKYWFIPVGAGKNRRTLVYDRDLAKAVLLVMTHADAAGKIYNVSDGEYHRLNEIIRAISHALGRGKPFLTIPLWMMKLIVNTLEIVTKAVPYKFPIGRSTLDKYLEDSAISSDRIQQELDYHPDYDLKTGWEETIEEMRQQGYF